MDNTSLIALLKQTGLKVTPARVKVYEILANVGKPLSVHDILKKLPAGSADQATVYRILEALKKVGLVKSVEFEHGHAHFEIDSGDHHHHIICESCGKVVDVSKCDVSGLDRQVLKISGFKNINRHSLEFFGLCDKCGIKVKK